jgi:ATPase family associated with various cellular activities (AAA)
MAIITSFVTGVGAELRQLVASSRKSGSVRACLLTTRDREHAMNVLKEAVCSSDHPLYHFTVAGRRRFDPNSLVWTTVGDGNEPTSLLMNARELKGGAAVVFEDFLPYLADDNGDRRARMLLNQMLSSETVHHGLVLVFLEPPESSRYLPSTLADQFIRLDVSYPRAEELEYIAREQLALIQRENAPLDVEKIREEAQRLAPGLAGLTRSAARDALRDSLALDATDFDAAFRRLQKRKAEQLSRELAMNVLDMGGVEIPIGLDYLLDFLNIHKNKMRITGPSRARGILLVGPPGTGKTMLARAIGHVVGLPVVQFRISALMNSLLGETERRFAQAFAALEAMSPNVVFIDEIEKAFSESSERDGGTMMRCTGALLSWLSDNPNPNFVVGTCNSLTRMGEIGLTMTRSERFDSSFFVDVPNGQSRRAMLERWLTEIVQEPAQVAVDLAEMTDRFSGADLRSLVKQARSEAESTGTKVTKEVLERHVERKRLRANALYEQFRGLREWARMYCDPSGPMD